MKKILHISYILCFSLLLSNCRKKNDKPQEETVTPTEETTTGSVTTSTATSFDGIFRCGSVKKMAGNTETNSFFASAYFSTAPTTFNNPSTSVKVSSVYLDGELLPYDEVMKDHSSGNLSKPVATLWAVDGANSIPSFKYTNSLPYPTISVGILPDSISKSTSFDITVQVANSTKAILFLYDGSNSQVINFELVNGTNTISVSSSNMTPLALGDTGFILFNAENKNAISTGGKNFQMSKECQIMKNIKIKN